VLAGFLTDVVDGLERRAGEFELAAGLQADIRLAALERDHLAGLGHRRPAEPRHAVQQRLDAARLVGDRRVAADVEHELLVLGAHPPGAGGLGALVEPRDEVLERQRAIGDLSHADFLPPPNPEHEWAGLFTLTV
jgi:hypothetical protein